MSQSLHENVKYEDRRTTQFGVIHCIEKGQQAPVLNNQHLDRHVFSGDWANMKITAFLQMQRHVADILPQYPYTKEYFENCLARDYMTRVCQETSFPVIRLCLVIGEITKLTHWKVVDYESLSPHELPLYC